MGHGYSNSKKSFVTDNVRSTRELNVFTCLGSRCDGGRGGGYAQGGAMFGGGWGQDQDGLPSRWNRDGGGGGCGRFCFPMLMGDCLVTEADLQGASEHPNSMAFFVLKMLNIPLYLMCSYLTSR